ncbi:hypothetical protein MTP03_01210 [Tsukamurella sp. PLM1]|nr:S49 family peptidase [Tsukamurella sp. PLM1]BDH55182.1 hypothetical protein MTP03_01210 [Tsukamurella sp. PLM1]
MSGGLGRGALNLAGVESVLRRAFETDDAVAVALALNSPGGSPAQSELIGTRIRQLAAKHELPVLAFCEDVAASGGYWLACAADEIYVTTTSIVGSIGVISASFGAKELIGRIGLERRVFTEGDAKHRLDMFEDVAPGDVEWLHGVQRDIHTAFREWVVERRGARLGTDPELFAGEVWIGRKAVELGLADGIGTLRGVLAERFPDADVQAMHTPKPSWPRCSGAAPRSTVPASLPRSRPACSTVRCRRCTAAACGRISVREANGPQTLGSALVTQGSENPRPVDEPVETVDESGGTRAHMKD